MGQTMKIPWTTSLALAAAGIISSTILTAPAVSAAPPVSLAGR
jgi:hypothetical protein